MGNMPSPEKVDVEDYMQDPEKFPNQVQVMNYENGRFEIMSEAEAHTRTDRQIVRGMAADGFFLRLTYVEHSGH